MNSRSIGRIISISPRGITAEIYESLGSFINTSDGIMFVGEIGSYISIYEIGRTVIGEIVSVEEKPTIVDEPLGKPNSSRLVNISLIGEIKNRKFLFGVSKMPLIFSEVCIISEEEFKDILDIEKEEVEVKDGNTKLLTLSLGKSVLFPSYNVKVNIDKFFGFHFSVFGNTGAGKSNTIARILQEIFTKKHYSATGAKFIILDSNGEYSQAFEKISEANPEISFSELSTSETAGDNNLEIPVWALSVDDWAILLHASEKTQLPVLKRAIDIAKCFYSDESNEEVKNHILASALLGILNSSDSTASKSDKIKTLISVFGTEEINPDAKVGSMTLFQAIFVNYGNFKDIESVISFLRDFLIEDFSVKLRTTGIVTYSLNQFIDAVNFATLYEGSISSQRIQEYTSTLTTRLQSFADGIHGKIFSKTEYLDIDGYVKSLIGNKQILNIDISSLDDSEAEVVAKVLSKLIFDYLRKNEKKATMPINLIIEEAHRFVKNETRYDVIGYNIFERIAKEGRKYGLLLGISSQRPSELSKTVVSQCSNFIIHRIQNPDDLVYLGRMVPYINQAIIDRLTYLPTGTALVFGTAINLPSLTEFPEADPTPDSHNARISELWYRPTNEASV